MSAHVSELVQKMTNWDKDERYMATNDLCTELGKDVKIDEVMEKRICAAVLNQLDDQSNDVQSVAVKCLGILLKKVHQSQVAEICNKLSSLLVNGKSELRDIYSIGLKTLIADVPEDMGKLVAETLTEKLLDGIANSNNDDTKRECLDNMTDLLRRFGHLVVQSHDHIMKALVKQLEHDRPVIRKRAAMCIGSLAVVSSDVLLNTLVEKILQLIEDAEKSNGNSLTDTRTLIQTIGTISRTVGHRLGRHLDRLVPLFLRFVGEPNDESMQTDAINELRENCFPGLESFVLRCPREVSNYIGPILSLSMKFMNYDPNYSYDDDSNDGNQMEEDDNDDMDDAYDDDEYGGSDDDDTSWKVRKSAVKVISAIISARPEMLEGIYKDCADHLVARFKEREENVRLDVIAAFNNLLQMTLNVVSSNSRGFETGVSNSRSGKHVNTVSRHHTVILAQLEEKVPVIVKAAQKQLIGNSLKTKSAIFCMLRTLILVLKGGLTAHLQVILGLVEKAMIEKNQTLKLDALSFLRLTFQSHAPESLQSSIPRLLPLVISAVNEEWYKIIAEALRVISDIIKAARPKDADSNMFIGSYEGYSSIAIPIYDAVLPRLEALDIDQEIKECAIIAVGTLFAYLGDQISGRLPPVLALLRRRMENEITRISTLKTIATIASSPLELDLSQILSESTLELSQFLRQQNRLLKQTTLQTFESLIFCKSATLSDSNIEILLQEAAPLICDGDLHLAHLSMKVTLSILTNFSKQSTIKPMCEQIYPRAVQLASSALLQGLAQVTLITLFQEFISREIMTYEDLFNALYQSSSKEKLAKQSVSNLAKCMAGICLKSSDPKIQNQTFFKFSADLKETDEARKRVALLCIGELGQQTDISAIEGVANLKDLILQCFESASEETKVAAAYALGHLAVGNMSIFLPVVLQTIENSHQQYLAFAALKEVIVIYAQRNMSFDSYLEIVLPLLEKQCKAEEEGVRNMVAECLGTLTSIHAKRIVPLLKTLIQDKQDKLTCWTVSTAMRFALSRDASPESVDDLVEAVSHILICLRHEDLEVRKSVLLLINAAVHHNPDILLPFVSNSDARYSYVLPQLFEVLDFKQVREVDLGPFKHKVDDGLPLRKASLTCIETMLDVIPDRLEIGAFMPKLSTLLTDKDDIQLQCHQIIIKLCVFSPGSVLGVVENLVEPFEKSIKVKNKEASTGTENDRSLEIVRSGLMAVIAINKIEDITTSRKWIDFIERLSKKEVIGDLMKGLIEENKME